MIGKRKRLGYRWRALLELFAVTLAAALLDAFTWFDSEMFLLIWALYTAILVRCQLEDMRDGGRVAETDQELTPEQLEAVAGAGGHESGLG